MWAFLPITHRYLNYSTKYTMIELIYALCEIRGEPFYVGRTSRTLEIRCNEHRSSSKTGTEAKYQHIREIQKQNRDFEIILLQQVGPGSKHFEDFWVYSLILDGYNLTNMKAGDAKFAAKRDAMLEMKRRQERFTDPETFLDARAREIKEAKARKAAQKLLAKTRKVRGPSDESTTRWAGDFGKVIAISKGLQSIKERRNI